MNAGIPLYIPILFILTALGAIFWFCAAAKSRTFLFVVLGWGVLQSLLGIADVYQDTESLPPRIILFGPFPALVAFIIMFATRSGRAFMDEVHLKTLTWFHTIRIPVEIVLVLLFHQGLISVYMTFEGSNFDLFSGITAPLVAYFAFRHGTVKKRLLLGWNILCLLLLLNVVVTAIFALPSPFQRLSLDQPNVAVLHFPFNLLPTVVVPLVLFAHLIAIRQLVRRTKNNTETGRP